MCFTKQILTLPELGEIGTICELNTGFYLTVEDCKSVVLKNSLESTQWIINEFEDSINGFFIIMDSDSGLLLTAKDDTTITISGMKKYLFTVLVGVKKATNI